VTHFQKDGEKPLLFCSQLSRFQSGAAIRGGVPIIFPWFGAREGEDAAHGFARLVDWRLHEVTLLPEGGANLRFSLPNVVEAATWPSFTVVLAVTVARDLSLELIVTNTSNGEFSFQNCFHTYFAVGDISAVSVEGLHKAGYLDTLENLAEKKDEAKAIEVRGEVDRIYFDASGPVEIIDRAWKRRIRIEKQGSASTVVWNPWLGKSHRMTDFGDEEYKEMICVESGNVARNEITLPAGKSSVTRITLSSSPL
jgi:D-hexose-6-phosphate mutarotase